MGKANTAAARRQAEKPRDIDRPRHGHDGQPPEFTVVRDHVYADGKREATESPMNINHSRLSWLFHHKRIEERQFYAGEQLARDWEMSLMQPTASSVIVGNGGGGAGQLPNDAKVAAMRRHGNARKLLGRAWPIVEMVAEQNMTVEKASAVLRINSKEGKGVLGVALHFLADHYGM